MSSNVTDNAAKSRYELVIDGHLSIAEYRRQGDNLVVTHVEVPDALRGQGIAAQLMAGVVEDAKARNLVIVPTCSYAVSYMQRHPQ